MKTINVSSSNGTLTVDIKTGNVIQCDMEEDGEGINDIIKFDFEEFRKHYNYTEENIRTEIDILDLGYWYKNSSNVEAYEEPVHSWRKEFGPKVKSKL